jgi:hypothetical protein
MSRDETENTTKIKADNLLIKNVVMAFQNFQPKRV